MSFDTRADFAMAAAKRGDFHHAEAVVIDLVAEDWENAAAHRAWGCLLLEQGKATDAVAALRIAASLDPRSAELHFELVDALLAEAEKNPFPTLTNWLEASDAVNAGLALMPGHERGVALFERVESQRALALNVD